jgi:hypothetical protein
LIIGESSKMHGATIKKIKMKNFSKYESVAASFNWLTLQGSSIFCGRIKHQNIPEGTHGSWNAKCDARQRRGQLCLRDKSTLDRKLGGFMEMVRMWRKGKKNHSLAYY